MITAIVLAAGESKRMGQPKMLMPWGDSTVLGSIINTLKNAEFENILVITGKLHRQLESDDSQNVQYIQNKDFANGEMLTSVQVGLRNVKPNEQAVLIVLGDQPQIEVETVNKIIQCYRVEQRPIIVPSYKMHRGHPWLIERSYWDEIKQLKPPKTLRDFLNAHNDEIDYMLIDSSTILQDIDTQGDYQHYKP